MAMAASGYESEDDSFSSSSSSDDEFLTIKGGQSAGSEDREALIRKKLLESFYGATVTPEETTDAAKRPAQPSSRAEQAEDEDDEESDEDIEDNDERRNLDAVASKDLDSPYFAHAEFCREHIHGSSVHDLLDTEERLALQVRTLDSTMQTLVYENYSKFIDATDAIKSIGVSCSANEEGLSSLGRGMQTIDEQSRQVEDALGSLRDAVAEKLRVKRLLTRLDSLLKLPTTLQQQIASGKYRLATKSYLAAHSILKKHSKGFESLKNIETECREILMDMVRALKRKLLHWSGSKASVFGDEDDQVDQDQAGNEGDWVPPPEPPKVMSEIFEAAGTLLLVHPDEMDDAQQISFDSGMSPNELKSMALAASVRLLDRLLDAHQIELQESMFSSPSFEENTYEAKLSRIQASSEPESQVASSGSNLIPSTFLDNVLEAATLFSISFGAGDDTDLKGSDQLLLVDFVSESFSSFLSHVRSVILEQQALKSDMRLEEDTSAVVDEDDDGDAAYGEISNAMTHLLRSVRDLASGLALPEVGIDVEFASSLVDQAIEVMEAMVRRRVSQKFNSLRLRVVQECLGPFAMAAISHTAENEARVVQIVQMASVALSDGLQMVDDTIRSILMGGVVISTVKGVDYEMVKAAVQSNSKRFVAWLACSLERLAGFESSDPKVVVEASDMGLIEAEEDERDENKVVSIPANGKSDDVSEFSDRNDESVDKVESSLLEVLTELGAEASSSVLSDFALAIAEMCRLAERSVTESINQSVLACGEGNKKQHKSSEIFQIPETSLTSRAPSVHVDPLSERFHLAASRVFTLYAMNRGSDAAALACEGFAQMASSIGDDIPTAPRPGVCHMLEVAKLTSIDCFDVLGGERSAGPVPDFPDDDDFEPGLVFGRASISLGGHLGSIKGLQLDVERMFTEKVPIYPHPSCITEFTRNMATTLVLKVALRAMAEQARLARFSPMGYRQMQVDVAFLNHMVPHFVKDEFYAEGVNARAVLTNLLNDIMDNVRDRCIDDDCTRNEGFWDQNNGSRVAPVAVVRAFMESDENEHLRTRFVIDETLSGPKAEKLL